MVRVAIIVALYALALVAVVGAAYLALGILASVGVYL